ncbi:MAG: YkgJ family cysteine cluster protein [Candidatus Omnitrophica bacterium]|nr:YkgJ family cysteine cluster protein [Candidatus Omnitrophota bacterium]
MNGPVFKLKTAFPFCKDCPADKNCCTGETVDLPVLTPKDIDKISKKTGLVPGEFSIPTAQGLSEIRSIKGMCYFYKQGKCTIYSVRPIDCKLFPFDAHLDDAGKPILVLHLNACPVSIDAEPFIKRAQFFFRQLHPYLEEFAAYRTQRFDRHSYKVLDAIT